MILLPLADLRELVEEENPLPLRFAHGLHDPRLPRRALELFEEETVLTRKHEGRREEVEVAGLCVEVKGAREWGAKGERGRGAKRTSAHGEK